MRVQMVVTNTQLVKMLNLELTFVHALRAFLEMAKSVKVLEFTNECLQNLPQRL